MSQINPITIDIVLQTIPLPQKGFGMPLVIGSGGEIAYQEVTKVEDLTGYTSADPEYKAVSNFFSQSPRPEKIAVYRKDTGVSYTDALTAISLVNNGWYAVLTTSRTKADLLEIANWVETQDKIFIGTTNDKTITSGRNLNREIYVLHSDASTTYHDAIIAGSCLTFTPGKATWAFKRGSGSTNSGFNSTDTNAIVTANGNVYAEIGGLIVTFPGKVTSGEFIDVIISRDYIKARLTEELHRLLIISPKIPYTLDGFAQVESALRSVFKQAGVGGIIATVNSEDDATRSDLGDYQYQITIPESLSDIPANSRASRILPISFTFRLAGAVHLVDISGTITI